MSEKKNADDLAEAIVRVDAGVLGPNLPAHTIEDLTDPRYRVTPADLTAPPSSDAGAKKGGVGTYSQQGQDSTKDTAPARVSVSVVDALVPSLKTLGENQRVILTDVRTGFSQTYENQQKIYSRLGEGFGQTYENQQQIYNKLKAQEQMLAKVAAGVAGLTAVTYAIQQEINTLVVLFGAAFLVLVAVLGFLVWKQMQMEKRMAYLLTRR